MQWCPKFRGIPEHPATILPDIYPLTPLVHEQMKANGQTMHRAGMSGAATRAGAGRTLR
jgi:hypothetical protein